MTAWRRALLSLRGQLLVAHLAVILVGVGTLFLAANLVAPRFFVRHMEDMAAVHPMGQPGMGSGLPPAMTDAMTTQLALAFRDAVAEALWFAAAAALVAAVVVSLVVSAQVAGPVGRLAIASRRIAAGHYDERVATAGPEELRQLGASFNEMAAQLEGAERRRSELIGDVAHELRTPVATIAGYVEGLLDGVVPPSERTWAKLHDEAGRLRRLTEDLQQLSRVEAHQLALVLQPVAPAAIIQAAVDRVHLDFDAKGVDLHVDPPAGLPQVRADPDRAVQVLTNLLTNAFRFTPTSGRVDVSASRAHDDVCFRVRDTGVGIAAEHLPLVFERFYRVDKSRARGSGGAGVGLTIARALVEAMGGRIWAESAGPNRGASFAFTLPIASRS